MHKPFFQEIEFLRERLNRLSDYVNELPQTLEQADVLSQRFTELDMHLTEMAAINEPDKCESELRVRAEDEPEVLSILTEVGQVAENVIPKQPIVATLQYRVAFERLLTQISTQFIILSSQEIDQGISDALKAIGEFTFVERVYVYSSDGKQSSLTHEWYATGFHSTAKKRPEIPSETFLWILHQLRQFKTVYVPCVADLPSAAEAEKLVLEELNVQTFVAVPLVYDSVLIGNLCFSSINRTKIWSEEDLTLLSTLGDTFANALARKYVESTLRESEERFRQLVDNIDEVFWLRCLENNRIIYVSPAYETIWGRSCISAYEDASSWTETIHPDDRNQVIANFRHGLQGEPINSEYRIMRPTGEIRWIRVRAFPIRNEQGVVYRYTGIAEDISDRILAFEQLQASLRDKEVLLQEIHHRVKNNLQIISSLLYLQGNRIKDEQVSEFLQDSQNRIESMALVHESLYRKCNFSGINFAEYVEKLSANLFNLYKIIATNISLRIDVSPDILIELNQAIPCGLIINELITNSLKHSFIKTQKGEVFISLKHLNEQLVLIVGNNGDDLPANFELENTQSMGLRLVITLVRQLQGTIELEHNGVIAFKIIFPSSY